MRIPRTVGIFLLVGFLASVCAAESIPNWPAPPFWSPPRVHGVTLQDITPALPFIGVTPCRQYDSRNFTPLLQATSRAVLLTGAPCGLPANTAAVSVNITIFSISGATGNGVFQVGTATAPTFAWINFPPTESQRGNAGALPLDGSGNLWVRAQMGGGQLHFTVDVNGYYSAFPNSPTFFEFHTNSGGFTLDLENLSTTCSGTCGLRQSVHSGNAIAGLAVGTTGANVGVLGETASNTDGTKGVWGVADTATAIAFGVYGQVSSSSGNSAGVAGTASQAGSNGGVFVNNGAPVTAALAFQDSGINYGFYTDGRIAGASLAIAGSPKNFVSPHPLDPSKEIKYASVEAPTVDVYFRGTGTLSNGYARIEVPDHFRFTAREGTYMTTLTPVGRPISLSVESEGSGGIVVRGNGNAMFHYVVYAERAEIEGYEPVGPNVTFVPELMEKVHLLKALPRTTKALLVQNGTLNGDGTYNEATARAMGWVLPEPVSQAQPQK